MSGIKDCDMTWLNGTLVGAMQMSGIARVLHPRRRVGQTGEEPAGPRPC